MIERRIEAVLKDLATRYPVVTITGPRQSGKTLCRKVSPDMAYVTLARPDKKVHAVAAPRGSIATYSRCVILNEIPQAPHLLSYVQVLVSLINLIRAQQ
jgi:hypothetical protein